MDAKNIYSQAAGVINVKKKRVPLHSHSLNDPPLPNLPYRSALSLGKTTFRHTAWVHKKGTSNMMAGKASVSVLGEGLASYTFLG